MSRNCERSCKRGGESVGHNNLCYVERSCTIVAYLECLVGAGIDHSPCKCFRAVVYLAVIVAHCEHRLVGHRLYPCAILRGVGKVLIHIIAVAIRISVAVGGARYCNCSRCAYRKVALKRLCEYHRIALAIVSYREAVAFGTLGKVYIAVVGDAYLVVDREVAISITVGFVLTLVAYLAYEQRLLQYDVGLVGGKVVDIEVLGTNTNVLVVLLGQVDLNPIGAKLRNLHLNLVAHLVFAVLKRYGIKLDR